MCQTTFSNAAEAASGEEWVVDNLRFRAFIGEVNRIRRAGGERCPDRFGKRHHSRAI